MRQHRLTKWRKNAEVSQRQLAKESDVDQGCISRVESGRIASVGIVEAALLCIAAAKLSKVHPLKLEDFLPDGLIQQYLKAMEG